MFAFATYAWFIALLSTISTGLFVGAMLLVALAVVPYWQSLPPQEFHNWFVLNGHWMGNVMIPLLFGSLALAVFTAIGAQERRMSFVVSALALLSIVVLYAVFTANINELLLTPTVLSSNEISNLLSRWSALHWLRIALASGSFFLSLFSLTWAGRWR